jgi:hypothetical protein
MSIAVKAKDRRLAGEVPTGTALAINRDDAEVVAGTEKPYSSGNVCSGSKSEIPG